jgi:hypothetical protein
VVSRSRDLEALAAASMDKSLVTGQAKGRWVALSNVTGCDSDMN